MKKYLLFLVIVVLALAACTSSAAVEPTAQTEQEQATIAPTPTTPPPTPTTPPPTPTTPPPTATPTATPTPLPKLDELVTAAMEGWNSDQISSDQIDLTISYFADDAVFKMVGFPPTIPSEFQGKEAIRAAYESWMPLHPKLEVKIEAVEGDTVTATTSYWSDPMRAMKVAPLVGKDVYIFADGKIASETWTLTEESQNKFASAMATAAAPTPAPPTPTLDPSVALLAGTYTTTITVQENAEFAGAWELEFTTFGILYLTWDGERIGQSPYAVTQDQVEIGAGPGCDSPGSYHWTLESGVLTFTRVRDNCTPRRTVLTTHPLLRMSGSVTSP